MHPLNPSMVGPTVTLDNGTGRPLREWMQIVESRDAPLYHGCSVYAAIQMLRQDRIEARTRQLAEPLRRLHEPTEGVSLTRDPAVAGRFGPVVLQLDQRRLAQRYRILPIDYWGLSPEANMQNSRRQDRYSEAEEFVVGPIAPVSRVLQAILMTRDRLAHMQRRHSAEWNRDEGAILWQHPLLRIIA